MNVRELDHIVLNVADVERSLAWYTELLGLAPERVDEWRDGSAPFPSVRVNDGCIIDLFAVERTGENQNHFCLVVDPADVDDVVESGRFRVLDGPGTRWGARGDGRSVYVSDPDGNTVELRSYGP
jgi:catechol 2,3-dioxygenase-like lactoylglutathione lyase family enzyme